MRLSPMSQLARFPSYVATFCLCLLALLTVGACRGVSDPAITQLGEARNIAIDLRARFATGIAASDRAVMADTDDESIAFARDAARATEAAEEDRVELASRLNSLHYQEESKLLDEFTESFVEYRKLDKMVLELAVENTNLKAQRLSFGPVREAADAFRDALSAVARSAPAKDRCRAEALAARAVLAVRDIQVLTSAPHRRVQRRRHGPVGKADGRPRRLRTQCTEGAFRAHRTWVIPRRCQRRPFAFRRRIAGAHCAVAPQHQRSFARAGPPSEASGHRSLRSEADRSQRRLGKTGLQSDPLKGDLEGDGFAGPSNDCDGSSDWRMVPSEVPDAPDSPNYSGAPRRIRICDLRLRRPTLYPTELVAQHLETARILVCRGTIRKGYRPGARR